MFNKLGYGSILAALVLVLSACAEDAPEPIDRNAASVSDDGVSRPVVSIFDTAVATGNFTNLVSALQTTGLDADLADDSKTFTVFAPTDAAFEKLGSEALNAWFADSDAMLNVLQYHVVPGKVIDSDEATTMVGSLLDMANGDNVSITHNGKNFFINTSEVIVTDVTATNGIIHVIDTVLTPPVDEPGPLNIVETIIAEGRFEVLDRALVSTGLADTLSDTNDTFTLLAPTDEAFAKLPDGRLDSLFADTELLKNTLLYHVVSGEAINSISALSLSGQQKIMANDEKVAMYFIDGKLKINQATVTSTDLSASNGIIHELDSILTPPPRSINSPDQPTVTSGSIYDVARNTPDFSFFADALEVAQLDVALGYPNDLYTVFLPTNSAFKALSDRTRDRFFSDPIAMRELVLSHMLPGRVIDSAVAVERVGFNLQAGNGNHLVITQQSDALWIENAKIRTTDITTVNGIIHTIDKVLVPR